MPITVNSCGGCDSKWTGVGPAHCSVCHQLFSSVSGFDAHRVRPGKCVDPATRGLVWDGGTTRRPFGFWKSPDWRFDDDARSRLAG